MIKVASQITGKTVDNRIASGKRMHVRINSKWFRDPNVKSEMEGRGKRGKGQVGAARVLEANKVNPFIKWVWGKP